MIMGVVPKIGAGFFMAPKLGDVAINELVAPCLNVDPNAKAQIANVFLGEKRMVLQGCGETLVMFPLFHTRREQETTVQIVGFARP